MAIDVAGADGAWQAARRLLAAAVSMEPAEIGTDAAIGVLPEWDSLAHMRLITALEEHLGRELPPDAVVAIESLADVVAMLERQTPHHE